MCVSIPTYKISDGVAFEVMIKDEVDEVTSYFCKFSTIQAFAYQLLDFRLVAPTLPFPHNDLKDAEPSALVIETTRKELNVWFSTLEAFAEPSAICSVLQILHQKQESENSSTPERSSSLGDLSFLKTMLSFKDKTKRKKRKSHSTKPLQISQEQISHLRALPSRASRSRSLNRSSIIRHEIPPQEEQPKEPSEEDSDDTMRLTFSEDNLLSSCMKKIHSGSSLQHIIEAALAQVLVYSRGSVIYLLRQTLMGSIVCEAYMDEKQKEILVSVPLDRTSLPSTAVITKCKQKQDNVIISGKENLARLPDVKNHPTLESIICIPLLQQRKFVGCLYITAPTIENFEFMNFPLVSALVMNLYSMIENSFLKTKLVRKKSQDLSASGKANYEVSAVMKCSMQSFDGDSWSTSFVVLDSEYLQEFCSPHDSSPFQKVDVSTITDMEVVTGNKAQAMDLLRKGGSFDSPSLCAFSSLHSLIHITYEDNSSSLWYVAKGPELVVSWCKLLNEYRECSSD